MIDDSAALAPGVGAERGALFWGASVHGEAVLVEYLGEWLSGTVLWEYRDTGRARALVRFETTAGLVMRQLRWSDELRPSGRTLELPLVDPRQPQV